MNLSLTQPDLQENVKKQFEDLISEANTSWQKEHKPDGTHKEISGEGNVVMGGFATYKSQLRCRVGFPSGVAQSIPNNTETLVTWEAPPQSDYWVPDGFWDNGALHSAFSLYDVTTRAFRTPEPGIYLLVCNLRWGGLAGAGTDFRCIIKRGGVEIHENVAGVNAATGLANHMCVVVIPFFPATAEDNRPDNRANLITVHVIQNTGGALSLATLQERISCTLVKIA